MLLDIPDPIAARAEQEARRTGRTLRELVVDLLRGAFGLPREDSTSEEALTGAARVPTAPTAEEALAAWHAMEGQLDPEEAARLAMEEVDADRTERLGNVS